MRNLCAWILITGVLFACSGDDEGSGGAAATGGTSTNGGSGAASGTSGNAGTGVAGSGTNTLALCDSAACACEDGIDNDADGETDGFDTECTGPNDDDEGSFATGIAGDNIDPKWQDCFFDGNSGAGDDKCRYHTDCLTGGPEATPENCSVTQQCLDFCVPRTPNGCDCFGCCNILGADGVQHNVLISVQCDADHLEDCESCIPTEECGNTCGECELCPGKTAADLPESCQPDAGTPYQCEGGLTQCEASADCTAGYYCSFGCCQQIPPD